jgi:hypothetical protein
MSINADALNIRTEPTPGAPAAGTETELILSELSPMCLRLSETEPLGSHFLERRHVDDLLGFFKRYSRWDIKMTRGSLGLGGKRSRSHLRLTGGRTFT